MGAPPGWEPAANPPGVGANEFPIKVSELGDAGSAAGAVAGKAASGAAVTAPSVLRVSRSVLDPSRAKQALAGMLTLDGLLGCAVVDSTTGLVLARELREDQPVDIELAAAASAQVLRTHRQAAHSMGMSDHIDEVMTSAGARQLVMRTVTRHPDLFLVALLDKHRTNFALARFHLMEIERGLT